MKKKSKRKVKLPGLAQYDKFGHQISLNFEQKGNLFKTSSGGLVTILMYLVLLSYFIAMFI